MYVREAKKQLRSKMKTMLMELSPESIQFQSEKVHEKLLNLEKFKESKKIALYMSMPHEIQTIKIIESCFLSNKTVYLPKCNYEASYGRKKGHLHMLKVNSFGEVLNLRPQGRFKILEPTDGQDILQTGELDIIIVPGVAFDLERKRLGHGAGFYDEFLRAYYNKFGKTPFLVGLGLKEQAVQQIPTEEHDWKLDCLVLPERNIIFSI
ncbi:5-formyltetrahydrofolate cyclo-ligase [Yamadazyma tenuis]|uniref:5-formyltetrahydrofolate cyclo-ligase n=1 Tax=Candida tenuis (strain ATCC 10573 / BCRC 21748 / CBS 615 / JCM 9827 / NBRC 10315 / NRRL Y-1498 / VKM Y-70) TaxID=590646 RepID=G3B5P0_CANTC|nr:5-formyltetrahydrofolate cyclo-ligase [Yamadazyma tenuis ATCC 10573]EGV63275.1 5-formyltetrahydrofolate cyclo-ligase [Yamadazyma tenuis ATCC 10573]WEJ96909.1 5-formyltetrahydrofolate cyclo-ligase [Yamadazyma tenuis]